VVLKWIFSNILREIDIIARYKTDGVFAIILPGQHSSGAETIIHRVNTEIQNYQLQPYEKKEELLTLNFGLSSLQVTEGTYESLLTSAEERLHNQGVRKESDLFVDLDYLLEGSAPKIGTRPVKEV